jgi:hypothetical protein
MKKSSVTLWKTHLKDLVEARAAMGNHSKATELRKLITHEHQRAMARRICFLYGKAKAGGVTSVLAPDDAGTLVEMTSKADLEQAIMTENESKY